MFKSVFAKYITAFMAIVIVSFAILAAIISSMTITYATETKQDMVYNAAYSVRQYVEGQFQRYKVRSFNASFADYLDSETEDIRSNLSVLVRYTGDLMICVTDMQGRITGADTASIELSGKRIPGFAMEETMAESYQAVTDLDGLLDKPCLIQGVPVTLNGVPVGAVFTCAYSDSVGSIARVMVKTILMATLWILLAALIAVYFISERIIGPLKEMSRAAKSFAAGKFDVRVPVMGHDEVSELAVAFNNMAAAMTDMEEMRRTFLGNVSHELRTPMTTISGFIDGILDGAIPPEKHQYYLNIISGEVKRLSRLVYTLLDISRIQAGERKFNKTAFDICEMARLILISFEQKIDEKHLNVDFDTDEENMPVMADRDAIYQIFYNLCDNAVKFSKENGDLTIRLIRREKKVYVSVYNEGQGIRESDLPHVFDRFYKADKSRSLDKTGVGLGLYIAKTIMDAHGEEIWVRSVYGEYCEFVFTLQCAHESQRKRVE